MSNNYRWRDRYISSRFGNVIPQGTISKRYISLLANKKGDGSAANPIQASQLSYTGSKKWAIILSSGNYLRFDTFSFNVDYAVDFFGQGIEETIVNNLAVSDNGLRHIHDMSINNVISSSNLFYLHRCKINFEIDSLPKCYNCVFLKSPSALVSGSGFSFVGLSDTKLTFMSTNRSFISNSDVTILQLDLNSYVANYIAFTNCRFKLGGETEYKALMGSTEGELRADFVARWQVQGITPPIKTEYGETLSMYRWVFSNEPNNHGSVVKDSIIDKFQKRRFIHFGWKDETVNPIEITNDQNIVNSLAFDKNNVTIANNSIRLREDLDISDITNEQKIGKIRSNIIWLGKGKQKLSAMNIVHNLAAQYGVMIDSDPAIKPIGRGEVQAGQFYLVRTKATGAETITYNSATYSTSLGDRNNIFIGVAGVTDWTGSDNIVVYRISDLAISGTIRMRIVDTIPSDTVSAVKSGYWYFVEPNDLDNPGGSVTYKGLEYPYFGSFLATDSSTPVINGNCRLRLCWKDDFDSETDKSFWNKIQQPVWFNVVPDDTRCLLENNNPLSVRMKWDDTLKTYIASGHPDFYAMVSADNGIAQPSFDITGKYLQMELTISILNPM